MAAAGAEEDDGGASLDIDNVHMLLQGQSVQRRRDVAAHLAAVLAAGMFSHLCITLMCL